MIPRMKQWPMILLLFAFAHSADTYLSQNYIDSTINEAYYGFVSSSREAGGQYTQESAIRNAQNVITQLNRLAENDPNQRYILSRIYELEQQVLLEQEEVRLKNEYERVTEINRLVDIFNEELFLHQPSFAKLNALYFQVKILSIDHGNQFATNFNQKIKAVNSILQNEMGAAYRSGNYEQLEELYLYSVRNRKYLRIDIGQYNQWRAQIQAKRDAEYLQANIVMKVRLLEQMVADHRVAEARRNVEVLLKDLEGASEHLSESFIRSTETQLQNISSSVISCEDSLVTQNMNLISAGKADEAVEYMNNVLVSSGVSAEKVSKVDRAILTGFGVERGTNAEVNQEIASLSASTSLTGNVGLFSMDDISAQIKASADSLREAQIQEMNDARSHYQHANRRAFRAKAKENEKFEENVSDAKDILIEVEELLIKGEAEDASELLIDESDFLLEYADADQFITLRQQVNNTLGKSGSSDPLITRMRTRETNKSNSNFVAKSAAITSDIYGAIEIQNIEKVAELFFWNEMFLEEHSSPKTFHALTKTVVNEYKRRYME